MIHDALLTLFPDFVFGDWMIQDDSDGEGPFIAEWHRPEPQPTKEALQALIDNYVEPEVFVPLTPWQVRQVLTAAGHRAQVEAFIASGSIELQDAWHYATEFKRDNALLQQAAAGLSLTEAEVDAMFRAGAAIVT